MRPLMIIYLGRLQQIREKVSHRRVNVVVPAASPVSSTVSSPATQQTGIPTPAYTAPTPAPSVATTAPAPAVEIPKHQAMRYGLFIV